MAALVPALIPDLTLLHFR
ncbi:hypothetical protein ACNKHL_05380 [Shigella flexneri]